MLLQALTKPIAVLMILLLVVLASSIAYIIFLGGEKPALNMAVEFNDHSAVAWIALANGWFRENNIDIKNLTMLQTGLEVATAMARGDIPIAWVCLGPAVVMYARGVPIKVLAMTHLNGYAIVVRPEIDSVKGLNSRKIASPGPGSPAWLLLHMAIDKYNLSDLEILQMPPYMALNALLTGQVDGASLPEHYVSLAESKGMRVLIRSQDLWPSMPGSVLVVREDFLREHPDIGLKLVEITVRGTEYINENFSNAVEIVAEKLNVPYDVIYRSMKNLNYTYTIDLGEVQKYIDLLVKYGAIEKPVKAEDLVDLTYLERVLSGRG